MSTLEKNESAVIAVAFWLVFIHVIVSFIFTILNFTAAGKTKDAKVPLSWSGIGWVVSLVVCIIVLVLLFSAMAYERQRKSTPCPLQLSYPDESSPDRKDIKNIIDELSKYSPPPNRTSLFSYRSTPTTGVLPYDKNRVYIIFTSYYKNQYKPLTICDNITDPAEKAKCQAFKAIISKYNNVPIGYVSNDKIYGLAGKLLWPSV